MRTISLSLVLWAALGGAAVAQAPQPPAALPPRCRSSRPTTGGTWTSPPRRWTRAVPASSAHRRRDVAPSRLRRRRPGTPNGVYGMIYAVVPGTQPLEVVDFSGWLPGRERRRGARAARRATRSPPARGPSRSGSRAASRAAGPPATATCCSSTRTGGSCSSSTPRAGTPARPAWKADSGAVFLLDGERPPAGGLDERRRRRPRHPARPRALRRGLRPRPDPARLPLDRPRHQRPRVPRLAHRDPAAPQRAADGGAAAAQGGQEHRRLSDGRPEDLPGDEDLRPDRGRQRQQHVRLGRLRHAVGQRRPEPRVRRASRRPTSRSSSGAGSRAGPLDGTHRLLLAHPLPAPGHAARPAGPYGAPAVPAGSERVVVATGRCGIPATARRRSR